jgi:hypothetical protein
MTLRKFAYLGELVMAFPAVGPLIHVARRPDQHTGVNLNPLFKIRSAKVLFALLTVCGPFTATYAENASDPTAALNYTDVKAQFFDTGDLSPLGDDRDRYAIEGAYMLSPKDKITYEVNYWDTDISGKSESDFESVKAKYINITPHALDNGLKYRLAIGAEVIADLGDYDKGIGTGTSQIAPLIGAGWSLGDTDTLITLVQYFHSIDEDDGAPKIRTTGPRLIWIHSFPKYKAWLKLDDKFSINHENSGSTGNVIEVQLGKFVAPGIGVYLEYLTASGSESIYDDGFGIGVRKMY